MAENPNAWLDFEHADFAALLEKWRYVETLDDGTYIDEGNIDSYLLRRSQGEAKEMHDDRKANIDPDLLFSSLMSRISGQFFESESRLDIAWMPEDGPGGLGDPDDPSSRAWQIRHDTDGSGIGLKMWMQKLFRCLERYERIYVLIALPSQEHGAVYWHIITPDHVTDWEEAGGQIVEAKIRHETSRRASLMEEPTGFVEVDLLTLGGQRRWRFEKKETSREAAEVISDEENLPASWSFFRTPSANEPRLPLIRSLVPFRQYVAFLLAKKAVALFNRASERDNRLRVAFTPFTVYKKSGGYRADATNPVAEQKRQGANFITIGDEEDLYTEEAPVAGTETATEVIADKRRNLFISASQTYENEAAQATATEIRHEERGGRVSALTLFAQRFDQILRECLFITEQIEHPGAPRLWGKVTAERTGRFKPDETESEAERDQDAFFPGGIPMTFDAFREAVRNQYESRSITVDEETFDRDAAMLYVERETARMTEAGRSAEQAIAVARASLPESVELPEAFTESLLRSDFVFNENGL